MTPELSICIPTFNRAKYLAQLIESLEPQLDANIEVVISDNASTDGTPEIIDRWRNIIPTLTYKRWDTNRGADQNYLSVVEMASGHYCWLLGSDDVAQADAVRTICAAIHRNPDCMLFARQLRTKDMSLIADQSFWSFTGERWFDFSQESFLLYLESCVSICGLFSYLSSIVFKRKIWLRDAMKQRLVGTAYAHADILIRQLSAGGTLLASDNVVVHCRCGNDSFSDGNKGKRLALDFDGYEQIGAQLAAETARVGIMRILVREHPWRNLIHVMRHKRAMGEEAERQFVRLLSQLGVSKLTISCYQLVSKTPAFEMFLMIEPLFKNNSLLSRVKRTLRRTFRLGHTTRV